jgi:hypothetical protein
MTRRRLTLQTSSGTKRSCDLVTISDLVRSNRSRLSLCGRRPHAIVAMVVLHAPHRQIHSMLVARPYWLVYRELPDGQSRRAGSVRSNARGALRRHVALRPLHAGGLARRASGGPVFGSSSSASRGRAGIRGRSNPVLSARRSRQTPQRTSATGVKRRGRLAAATFTS